VRARVSAVERRRRFIRLLLAAAGEEARVLMR
jgi:hypothetical protein